MNSYEDDAKWLVDILALLFLYPFCFWIGPILMGGNWMLITILLHVLFFLLLPVVFVIAHYTVGLR